MIELGLTVGGSVLGMMFINSGANDRRGREFTNGDALQFLAAVAGLVVGTMKFPEIWYLLWGGAILGIALQSMVLDIAFTASDIFGSR